MSKFKLNYFEGYRATGDTGDTISHYRAFFE